MSYTPTEWKPTDVVTATRMNSLEQAVGEMNMNYTPNVWVDGDVLTAAKMNALEQAVASGGGGGSSDFSVANVTIIGESNFTFPIIFEEDDQGEGSPAMIFCETMTIGNDTYRVPLYKGTLVVEIFNSDIEVSGNITSLFDYTYLISGDCTITIL